MNIETPRGRIITVNTGNGQLRAKLEWNPNFNRNKTTSFSKAQKFIDSEVLRLSSPLVPFRTGMLEKSGKLGTVIGSGVVTYVAPYAKRQYYENKSSGQRGAKWFERMKASHKKEIEEGAKKIAGES